ncbi:MAG: FGGY family carbohydrate kinase [Geminicoccaceae bacterium]
MDLVLGIDSSTTSTKAIAWDRAGTAVAEGRATLPIRDLGRGWMEQSVEDWWRGLGDALRDLFRQVDPARVIALSISNQRETVGFLDEAGAEVRPAILWLDERCRADIDLFGQKLPPERFRAITGKTPDPTPAVFSLHWLQRCEPENWARTASFVDVLGYLGWRLTGRRLTSWGSADPHGLMDLAAHRYSPEILGVFGLSEDRFFPMVRPGAVVGEVGEAAAAATGLRPGTLVVAGGGDGQASGLGCATLGAGRAYLNLGTAAVSGVWGPASSPRMPSARSPACRARATSTSCACAPVPSSPTGACASCSAPIPPPTPASTTGWRPRPRPSAPERTASCCCPTGPAPWRRSGIPMPAVRWSACAPATAARTTGAPCWRASPWTAPWATPRSTS